MLERVKTWFMEKQAQRPSKAPELSAPQCAGDVFVDPEALERYDVYLMLTGDYYPITAFQVMKDWHILVDYHNDAGLTSLKLLPTDPVWVVEKG